MRKWNKLGKKQLWMSLMLSSLAASPVYADDIGAEEPAVPTTTQAQTAAPASAVQATAYTTIITREDIARYHYRNALEALTFAPGVIVADGMPAAENAAVYIDGDSRVAVFVDGRRMNLAKGNAFPWEFAPPTAALERIEIVHGAGYGAFENNDAPAGIINFVTRKGEEKKSSFDIGVGNQASWAWQLTTEGAADGWHWMAAGGRDTVGEYTAKRPDGSKRTWDDVYAANREMYFRFDRDLTDSTSMTLTYGHMSNELNREPDVRIGDDKRMNNITFSYNYKEGTDTPAYVRLFHLYRQGEEFQPTSYAKHEDEPTWYHWKNVTDGIDWHDGWRISKDHIVTAYVSYEKTRVDYDTNDVFASLGGNANYEESNDVWRVNVTSRRQFGKFSLHSSMEYSHDERFGGKVLTAGGFVYRPDTKTEVYGDLENIYRTPSLDQTHYNRADAGLYGNRYVRPEEGWKLTGGIRHRFDERTMFDVRIFHSRITNPIYWSALSSTYVTPVNADGERSMGIGMSLAKKLSDRYDADLSYTYTDRKVKWGAAETAGILADPLDVAPHAVKASLRYHDAKWTNQIQLLGLWGRADGAIGRAGYSGNAFRVDASFGYHMNDALEVYFKAKNIFNASYETTPAASAYQDAYAQRGRLFMLGMTYRF